MSSPLKTPCGNWLDEVVASVSIAPYYRDDAVVIFNTDCKEIVPQMPKVCLLLTDPPYGIGENGQRNASGDRPTSKWKNPVSQHYVTFDDSKPPDKETFELLLSISDNQIIWGGNYFTQYLRPSMCWLIWNKKVAEGERLSAFEMAWTSYSSKARMIDYLWAGFKKQKPEQRQHPTQKPLDVLSWCIHHAGDVQTILDPFAGSGTTAVAAKLLGRKCVCIEREERYCEIAAKRCAQDYLQLTESAPRDTLVPVQEQLEV